MYLHVPSNDNNIPGRGVRYVFIQKNEGKKEPETEKQEIFLRP
jgi:hypothetical protein